MKQQLTGKHWTAPYLRKGRGSDTGPIWSNQESPVSTTRLNSFIKDMMELRDNGTLSKEQFDQFVALACSVYIEQEVEKQIGKVLEEKLSPERLARYFSLSY